MAKKTKALAKKEDKLIVQEPSLELQFITDLRKLIKDHKLKNGAAIVQAMVYEATYMALLFAPSEHCALGTIQAEISNAYLNWECEQDGLVGE